jgi:hypothetical protein
VFYYSATAFTSTSSTCNDACHYLEAAPTTGSSAWTDVQRSWATGSNQSISVFGAEGTAIGTGYQNTLAVVAQTGNVAATSAAVEARAYRGPNNKTDWFLPSKDELNQLYTYGTQVGGLAYAYYWSSSQHATLYYDEMAYDQHVGAGYGYQGYERKSREEYVRPVRAF